MESPEFAIIGRDIRSGTGRKAKAHENVGPARKKGREWTKWGGTSVAVTPAARADECRHRHIDWVDTKQCLGYLIPGHLLRVGGL